MGGHLGDEVFDGTGAVYRDRTQPVGGGLLADLLIPQRVSGEAFGEHFFWTVGSPCGSGSQRVGIAHGQNTPTELGGRQQEHRLVKAGKQGRDIAGQDAEVVDQDDPVIGKGKEILDEEADHLSMQAGHRLEHFLCRPARPYLSRRSAQ